MISAQQYREALTKSLDMLAAAQIVLTPEEQTRLEVADFGLGELEKTGLQILTYVNTERCCAKELVMLPRQTCPEHWHPTIAGVPGKEETFRCRWGTVYLYVPGEPAAAPSCRPPAGSEAHYRMRHEVRLGPGEQYTLAPDTPHWFQAGPKGAIISEFSTHSTDEADVFTDPSIQRMPVIADGNSPAGPQQRMG
ncbi:MAG: D-lyxose/D-mannose family sugar isomerase [Bryobacteraceae bacterium]|jgi:D-lyxose ketol-isomerase